MNKLGRFVKSTVKSLKAEQAIKLHRLKSAWFEAVGPIVASQTEPVRLKGKPLYVRVSSPAWSQEVSLQQPTILKIIRGLLPEAPNKISCWVGEVHQKAAPKPKAQRTDDELVPWKNIEIPEDRMERIESHLAGLEDGKIKDKMRGLMILSVQREIYKLERGDLPCPVCGNFRPEHRELCKSCEQERAEERERKALRMLASEPWLTYQDLVERTHLKTKADFMKVRKKLLANLMLSAWQGTSGLEGEELQKSLTDELRGLFLEITMLRCTLPVHSLTPKHFYYALGRRLASAYLAD